MSPLPTGQYPTNALVAAAWVGQRVPGIAEAMVATKLPRDPAAWAELGFVQITPITGSPEIDVPIRRPLVQIDCYAVTLDAGGTVSTKPPIGKANRLAELIRVGTELPSAKYSSPVTLPAIYGGAIVLSAYPLTEPTEVTEDPAGYARVTFDLAIDWVRA